MPARLIAILLLSCAACTTALEQAGPPIGPGDRVDGMLVTTGAAGEITVFDYCDPFTEGAGVYVRKAEVPSIQKLNIGWGRFADTQDDLNEAWPSLSWELTLDGRQVDLAAFGTRDRSLILDGKYVILREWKVMLTEPTPGAHTLHYVLRRSQPGAEAAVTDLTCTFTVAGS